MPTLAVPRALEPARLLSALSATSRPCVLDGGGSDSWGDGTALLTANPRATLAVYADGRARVVVDDAERWIHGSPFALWQAFLSDMPARLELSADAEAAGFVTALSYDLKHWVEALPRRHRWPSYPILYCAFHDWHYRYQYATGRAVLHVQESTDAARILAATAYDDPLGARIASTWLHEPRLRLEALIDRQTYREQIQAILRYIAAGDVYQVNFAHPFVARVSASVAPQLFARLQGEFPMPFAAYLDTGDCVAVSSSPECFLTVEDDRIATFPIKGTRSLSARDSDLRGDPKEQAEHVMIVDLERNDLGRICATGTVEVSELAALRRYPLLAHMVSTVRGRLRPLLTLPDIIMATFPGGSITGAPKIRAMQIIEELEVTPRGIYTGAIGWTDLRGNSRFNLAIRTAVFADGQLTYHAGGGVVADSDPDREYEETLLKSEALMRSVAAL